MGRDPAEEWVRRLNAAGIPVAKVKFPVEVFDDPQAEANGMLSTFEHPAVGAMTTLAPPVALDGEGFVRREPVSAFGSDTEAILAELGFGHEEVGALVQGGVVRAE